MTGFPLSDNWSACKHVDWIIDKRVLAFSRITVCYACAITILLSQHDITLPQYPVYSDWITRPVQVTTQKYTKRAIIFSFIK